MNPIFAKLKGWWMLWECWTTLLGRPIHWRLHCFTLSLLGFFQEKSDSSLVQHFWTSGFSDLGVPCLRDIGVVAPISELNASKCFTTCLVESFKLMQGILFELGYEKKRKVKRHNQQLRIWHQIWFLHDDRYTLLHVRSTQNVSV